MSVGSRGFGSSGSIAPSVVKKKKKKRRTLKILGLGSNSPHDRWCCFAFEVLGHSGRGTALSYVSGTIKGVQVVSLSHVRQLHAFEGMLVNTSYIW